jgi:hypothetical protein
MSDFQITCVTKEPYTQGHGHIVSVGIGDGQEPVTVEQAYSLLAARHRLYTVSPSTGTVAQVEPCHCHGVATLRSTADAVHDNNLDNLDSCRV